MEEVPCVVIVARQRQQDGTVPTDERGWLLLTANLNLPEQYVDPRLLPPNLASHSTEAKKHGPEVPDTNSARSLKVYTKSMSSHKLKEVC